MGKINPLFIATIKDTEIFHENHPVQFWLGWVRIFGSMYILYAVYQRYAFGLETAIVGWILFFGLIMYDRHVVNMAIKNMKGD